MNMKEKNIKLIMEMIFIFILPLVFILPAIKITDNYVYDNNGNFVSSDKVIEYDSISYYQEYRNVIEDFNIFDKSLITANYIDVDGVLTFQLNRCVSDYIPITPNTIYYGIDLRGVDDGTRAICFYNSEYEFVSFISLGLTGLIYTGSFTTPNDVRYMRVNLLTYYIDNVCINISVDSANGNYVPYGEDLVFISDTDYTGNATLIKSPLSNIKEVVVEVLKINTDNVVVNIAFDYTCLWFIMFVIWHLFYTFIDFIVHLARIRKRE